MAQQVYMDIPAVRNMAKRFTSIGETLKTVSRTLQALVNVLKSTAFVGAVGGLAVAHFMEAIKPFIDKMAQQCAEMGRDLDASVSAYERGDATGATRFY